MSVRVIGAVTTAALWLFWLSVAGVTSSPRELPLPEQSAVYRVIGEWDGQVAVFLPQADSPETVYDTMVITLPEAEQKKLTAGIEVDDSDQLKRLLEDYLS